MNASFVATFEDIKKALGKGDDRRARILLYRHARFCPDPDTKLGRIAMAFSAIGNTSSAVQVLRDAIKLGADPLEHRRLLALVFMRANIFELAEAEWTTLLDDDPDHVEALMIRGFLRVLADDLENATLDLWAAEVLIEEAAAVDTNVNGSCTDVNTGNDNGSSTLSETAPAPAPSANPATPAASTPSASSAASTAPQVISMERKQPMSWWHTGTYCPSWTVEDKNDALTIEFRPSAWPTDVKSVKVRVELIKTAEGTEAHPSCMESDNDDHDDDPDPGPEIVY